MAKKYKPFPTTRLCREWLSKNCGSCKKGWEEKRLIFRCEWEKALYVAMVDDGQITKEVAKGIGLLDNYAPGWYDPKCTMWECPGWSRR